MTISERILRKLKHINAIREESNSFDSSILPPGTEFLGIYHNSTRLKELSKGARFYQFDPVLGHRYKKSSAILFLRNNLTLEKYLCITDKNGFVPNSLRSLPTEQRIKDARAKGQKSLFLLGGSTVAHCSGYLPDTEIAAQLEVKLTQRYPNKYIVINAGTGGYATDNQFKYLIYDILPLKPDMVIFYDGWNDCSYLNGLLNTFGENYKRGSVKQSYSMKYLYDNSLSIMNTLKMLQRLVLRKTIENIDRLSLLERITPRIILHPLGGNVTSSVLNPLSVEIYANNLMMANAICEAWGIKFMHFLQPLLITGKKPLTEIERLYLNYISDTDVTIHTQFYDLFESRNFKEAELFSKVDSVSLRGIFDTEKRQIYKDAGHVDALGNGIIANAIANYL